LKAFSTIPTYVSYVTTICGKTSLNPVSKQISRHAKLTDGLTENTMPPLPTGGRNTRDKPRTCIAVRAIECSRPIGIAWLTAHQERTKNQQKKL